MAGAWNDMNEPSVFDNDLEKTLPFETLHNGSVEHRNIHNMYGFLQVYNEQQFSLKKKNIYSKTVILFLDSIHTQRSHDKR